MAEGTDAYKSLIEKIARGASLSVDEVERKIEGKRAKLSGLVSKEGAAQIIAAELGLNFDKERMKISELVEGMKRANIVGKVVQISPVRSYEKNGRQGKVVNLVVADESSTIKTVLWDTNHISLIETGKINVGDVIEISNGGIRSGELHLSSFGDIKVSKEKIEGVSTQSASQAKSLKDAKPGMSLRVRALIVQTFEPRYFEVCPECKKKSVDGNCLTHGKITPEKRALMNIVIDDGTETMRSTMFGEKIEKLGLTKEEIFSLEKFAEKKDSFLGEEKIFVGNLKSNSLYNTVEFTIEDIEEVNADNLIKELEASASK